MEIDQSQNENRVESPESVFPKRKNRRFFAILVAATFGWGMTYISEFLVEIFGIALFVLLPLSVAVCSTVIGGYKNSVSKYDLRLDAYLTLTLYCVGLLIFAFEGLICLIMAAPFGIVFTWLGYLLGYQILKQKKLTHQAGGLILVLLSVPAVLSFEYLHQEGEDIRSVVTCIEINAAPDVVWKNLVEFPVMDEPEEFIFTSGIAYPISARIVGTGVGAMRYCNFSTGSFVEPITVWEESSLLKFDVIEQPEPMKELSPYDIHPTHLNGHWVAKEGQFKLTPLANGRTQLEGTTWYTNRIKPDFYWTLWSDYIVHKIHLRVLEHIKTQCE